MEMMTCPEMIGDSGYQSVESSVDSNFKKERRKAQKVMAERKRRERIDKCLDQLKFILIANQNHPSGIEFEKTDILELTLRHIQKLQGQLETDKLVGFATCLRETQKFLLLARVELTTIESLTQHLLRLRPRCFPFDRCNLFPNSSGNQASTVTTAGTKRRKWKNKTDRSIIDSSKIVQSPASMLPMFTSTPSFNQRSSLSFSSVHQSDGSFKQVLFQEISSGGEIPTVGVSDSSVSFSTSCCKESSYVAEVREKRTLWRPWTF